MQGDILLFYNQKELKMSAIIRSKKGYIPGMIVIQLVCLSVCAFFFYKIFLLPENKVNHERFISYFSGIAFSLLVSLVSFFDLLFIPIGASINEDENHISFNYLLSKEKIISTDDILAFCTTTFKVKSNKYSGLIIYLQQSGEILVSDYSLEDYILIQIFLEKRHVNNNGDKKFSKIEYISHQFKSN